MSERLPEFIDPLRLAAQGRLLNGQLALSQMQRLTPTLASTRGTVDIQLEFGQDGQNISYLRGQIRANLELICQRCLQALAFSLEAEPCLGIVTSQTQADRLPEQYEPLLVDDDLISLAAVIEDEVLLSLPAIPKHENEDCLDLTQYTEPELAEEAPRKNPFTLLKRLKDSE